jgi:hypothetical protein
VWRIKFLLMATVLNAFLIVLGFIIHNKMKEVYKWVEDPGNTLEYTTGFMTGVY